jgi:hypothetical protein
MIWQIWAAILQAILCIGAHFWPHHPSKAVCGYKNALAVILRHYLQGLYVASTACHVRGL